MIKNKKGVLGLDTVKVVLISLLVLAVVAVAAFLAINNLVTVNNAIDVRTNTTLNETVTPTSAGVALGGYTLGVNTVCSIISVVNRTTGTLVTANNYSVTGCYISNTSAIAGYWPVWNVSYSVTYASPNANSIMGNVSNGTSTFFSYVPTFFVLLAVVVLILIIAIVIIAVTRFSPMGGSLSVGGRSESLEEE